jgi:oligoendopeptidase F
VSLRKRILGVDELKPYDLRAPLFPEVDREFDYATSSRLVREALSPLGDEYGAAVNRILGSRWIDVYENAGKSSGAYSGGSYATPPFILLNHQNKLTDVYTLAHEMGHSVHSYFTRQTQPFISGDYTIFLAEVASTLNEALLTAHLLNTLDDPALRRKLVTQQLESIRATLFRQTSFAELELEMHRHVESGQAITAEWLSERYQENWVRYYGPEVGIEPGIEVEWAYVPHFYYNFYVYQYATGVSAALALAGRILMRDQTAIAGYLNFLRAGSSRPPIEVLRDAGVDMITPEPIEQAIGRFDGLLDELEVLAG